MLIFWPPRSCPPGSAFSGFQSADIFLWNLIITNLYLDIHEGITKFDLKIYTWLAYRISLPRPPGTRHYFDIRIEILTSKRSHICCIRLKLYQKLLHTMWKRYSGMLIGHFLVFGQWEPYICGLQWTDWCSNHSIYNITNHYQQKDDHTSNKIFDFWPKKCNFYSKIAFFFFFWSCKVQTSKLT